MAHEIPQYVAKTTELNQSDSGYSAFQTAGRRTGPLYNEAGQLAKEDARDKAEADRARMWPYDMLALERAREGSAAKSDAAGVRVEAGGGGIGSHSGGGGGRGNSAGHVAGNVGRLADGLAAHGRNRSQDIDTETGLPVRGKGRYSSVLEGGDLRYIDNRTGDYVKRGEARNGEPNKAAEDAANQWPYLTDKQREEAYKYRGTDSDNPGGLNPKTIGTDTGREQGDAGGGSDSGPASPGADYGGGDRGYVGGIVDSIKGWFGGEASTNEEE